MFDSNLPPLPRYIYPGSHVDLQVLDRELMARTTHERPYAVISITDPAQRLTKYKPVVPDSDYLWWILELDFHDVDQDEVDKYPDLKDRFVFMSDEDAVNTVNFIEGVIQDRVNLIVIHCEAGICRSAGVAAAIAKVYNGDDAFFFKHFVPNRMVFRKMMEEFHTRGLI